MDDLRSDTARIISMILIGLFVIVLVGGFLAATFGLAHWAGYNNNQKVREMTNMCISQGYDGWHGDDYEGKSECYND